MRAANGISAARAGAAASGLLVRTTSLLRSDLAPGQRRDAPADRLPRQACLRCPDRVGVRRRAACAPPQHRKPARGRGRLPFIRPPAARCAKATTALAARPTSPTGQTLTRERQCRLDLRDGRIAAVPATSDDSWRVAAVRAKELQDRHCRPKSRCPNRTCDARAHATSEYRTGGSTPM